MVYCSKQTTSVITLHNKRSTCMHMIFRTDMIVYLLAVSEITLACSVINMALFFPGLSIRTASLTLHLKKVEN